MKEKEIKLKILDLYAGTGSSTKAFEDAGHQVIKIELNEKFEADERDVLKMTSKYLKDKYGEFDFIWASPPCITFSIAGYYRYYNKIDGKHVPIKNRIPDIKHGKKMVEHAIKLIEELNPVEGFVIENPRGLLRHQPFMKKFNRTTITYCQYGDTRMKPTDLWYNIPNWKPRPMCSPGSKCHENKDREGGYGTTRLSRTMRSVVPKDLGKEILKVIIKNKKIKERNANR